MRPLRPLHELLEVDDPAWPKVQSWVEKAINSVEVLPAENAQRSQALLEAQVTISPLGWLGKRSIARWRPNAVHLSVSLHQGGKKYRKLFPQALPSLKDFFVECD
jgi:hypothetical protein